MAAAIAAPTVAVIAVCVVLLVCLIALVVLFIAFCRVNIKPDTNIRKRLIASAETGGYVEEQTKQTNISMVPRPVMIPAPLPVRMPVRRTEIIQEALPVVPTSTLYPPAVVQEVVYRYEPTEPVPPSNPIYAPVLPPTRPLVRSNSWSQPAQDVWVMVKNNSAACPDCGNHGQGQVVTASSGTQCACNQHAGMPGTSGGAQYSMNQSLMHYDLAVPSGYRYTTRYQTPGATGLTQTGSRAPMNGMGEASYVVGAQQSGIYGQPPRTALMGAASGLSNVFQPAYKSYVKNM